jgi:hypothetical protein
MSESISLKYSPNTNQFATLLMSEGAEQQSNVEQTGEGGGVAAPPPNQHGIGASRPEASARIQSFQVKQFTGTDYSVWSSALQLNLMHLKVWEVVNGERTCPQPILDDPINAAERKRFQEDNIMAANVIFQALDAKHQKQVQHLMLQSWEMWNYLYDVNINLNFYTQMEFQNKFHDFRWTEGIRMEKFLENFTSLLDDLRRHDVYPTERELVYKLLGNLPPDYKMEQKMFLKERNLTVDHVIRSLRAEAVNRRIIRTYNDDVGYDVGEANASAGRTRGPRGRGGRDSRARGRGRYSENLARFESVCYTCGERGHKAVNCPKGGRDVGGNKRYLCFRCHSDQHKIVDCPLAKADAAKGSQAGTQPKSS